VPRFKQFVGTGTELETGVNEWLAEFEPDVSQMTQTVSDDGSVTIGFLYEESFRGQERRLSVEHGMISTPASPPGAELDDAIRVAIDPVPPASES